MEGFDAHDNVLTIIAHDDTMVNVVGVFPNTLANDWKSKGWREKGLWRFLGDFGVAVEAEEADGKQR